MGRVPKQPLGAVVVAALLVVNAACQAPRDDRPPSSGDGVSPPDLRTNASERDQLRNAADTLRGLDQGASSRLFNTARPGFLTLEVVTVLPPEEERSLVGGTDEHLAALEGLVAHIEEIQVVHRLVDADPGTGERIVVDTAPHDFQLLEGLHDEGPRFLITVEVPFGIVDHVRLIAASATLSLAGEEVDVRTGSGAQAGLKIRPTDGDGFEIDAGFETVVRLLYDPFEELRLNNGVGFSMQPNIPAVVVPRAERDRDGDGFTVAEGDCDDDNINVAPGAHDVCEDGRDQDCSGADAVCEEPSVLVVPPIDPTVPTQIQDRARFIFEGDDAVQTGVAADAIAPHRMTVITGTVVNDAHLVAGATVTVVDSPYGQTTTDAAGSFAMVVSGGEPVPLVVEAPGRLPQRVTFETLWNQYLDLGDVVLTPTTPVAPAVDASSAPSAQVIPLGSVTDADGTREAVLFIPPSGQLYAVFADGTELPLSEQTRVRGTEYSVGDLGPRAIPGPPPANAGYLYAIHIGVEEADALGASHARLNGDGGHALWVDDFVGFPDDMELLVGRYDTQEHRWEPAGRGAIIRVPDLSDAAAVQQARDDGASVEEVDALVARYPTGHKVMRIPLEHLGSIAISAPVSPIPGAEPPPATQVLTDPTCDDPRDVSCPDEGVTLQHEVRLWGTPLSLHYSSGRVPGRSAAYEVTVPLTEGGGFPAGVAEIELHLQAGASSLDLRGGPVEIGSAPTVRMGETEDWGGRPQGEQQLEVRSSFAYPGFYNYPLEGQAFGDPGAGPATSTSTRDYVRLRRDYGDEGRVGMFDARRAQEIGGFLFTGHAAYDAVNRIAYLGDGSRVTSASAGSATSVLAGTGANVAGPNGVPATTSSLRFPTGLSALPDGGFLVTELGRVRRVLPDGDIVAFAGTGVQGYSGDGGSPLTAQLDLPADVMLCAGAIYIADAFADVVRKISDGVITTFAGTGVRGFSGDGGPAHLAQLAEPSGLACGADGSVFIADQGNAMVRRVGADLTIHRVLGGGTLSTRPADGDDANDVQIQAPFHLDIGPLGRLHVTSRHREFLDPDLADVLRVEHDNSITNLTIAVGLELRQSTGIQVEADGDVLIGYQSDPLHPARRGVDRLTTRLTVEQVIAPGALLHAAGEDPDAVTVGGLHFAPDGSLLLVEATYARVWRFGSQLPGVPLDPAARLRVSTGDATLVFDARGRHLETQLSTGEVAALYGYDASGFLSSITDIDGRTIDVLRGDNGWVTSLFSPALEILGAYELGYTGEGWLSRVNQLSCNRYVGSPGTTGLLTNIINESGRYAEASYDVAGRIDDVDPGDLGLFPFIISGGEEAVVTFDSRNTTDCYFSDGTTTQQVSPKGFVAVSPTQTTTYELICNGASGPVASLVELEVRP